MPTREITLQVADDPTVLVRVGLVLRRLSISVSHLHFERCPDTPLATIRIGFDAPDQCRRLVTLLDGIVAVVESESSF
jgi:hypothetical protein